MTYEQIVKQLINGNHLNEEELKQAMALRDILNALLVGRVKEYTKEFVEKDGLHTVKKGKVVAK